MEFWIEAFERVGFPSGIALFGCFAIWKAARFIGLRMVGEKGYITEWFQTTTNCQKQQAEAMTCMAASTASIQTLIERDVESRLILDKRVIDLIERIDYAEHESTFS